MIAKKLLKIMLTGQIIMSVLGLLGGAAVPVFLTFGTLGLFYSDGKFPLTLVLINIIMFILTAFLLTYTFNRIEKGMNNLRPMFFSHVTFIILWLSATLITEGTGPVAMSEIKYFIFGLCLLLFPFYMASYSLNESRKHSLHPIPPPPQ